VLGIEALHPVDARRRHADARAVSVQEAAAEPLPENE
jgi:hypothetical protein